MPNYIKNFYLGMSGLLLPVPNKSFFPLNFKDKSRLSYYGSLLNTIEINSSFYKIPMPTTVEKWAADVPKDFKFSFKLFKEITHTKGFAFDETLIAKFLEVINRVEDKRGCLLVQLPPSVRIDNFLQLQSLMFCLRASDPDRQWKIVFEFRHKSLFVDEIYELLEEFRFGLVVHDKLFGGSPIVDTGVDFVYLRFHGPNGNYRESYADEVLADYATYIAEWLADGKQVFVYFNNTMGAAHANAATLSQFVNDLIT